MRYDLAFAREGYHSALMTTFRIDPPLFEDVILVRLRSNGCRNIAVLADQGMTNLALTESGPTRMAGRRYHLAKRRVNGAFHSKIVLQLGETSGRLMIGSANLTGAGLQSNFENVSILEVTPDDGAAAPLLAAALDYFAGHADSDDVAMRETLARARQWTPWLDGVEPTTAAEIDGKRVEFVTENDAGGIAASLMRASAGDRIGRIVCLSPYWDKDLSGVRQLREATGAQRLHLIVDPEAQDFTPEAFVALEGAELHAIDAHPAVAARIRPDGTGRRRLHAKLVVAEGERFDYVLSGSANMSRAALFSSRTHGNAEAGLLCLESAGTAIVRLDLGECLATPFPTVKIRCRSLGTDSPSGETPVPRDGGALVELLGGLIWRPPVGVDPAGCSVELFGADDLPVAVSRAIRRADGWLLEAEGWSSAMGPAAVYGLVRFEDHGTSAPVPIAGLDRLRTASRQPLGGRFERYLRAISAQPDPDIEGYELLERLLADVEATAVDRLKPVRRLVETDSEESTVPMPPADFAAIAKPASVTSLVQSAVLGDLRALVNRAFAIYEDTQEAANALDREIGGLKPKGTSNGPSPGAALQRRPAFSLQQSQERFKKLVSRLGRALSTGKADPMAPGHALRLRYLILAVLNAAAPAGSRASDAHPLVANSREGDWVRLLGRLLHPLPHALLEAAGQTREPALDEEVELLALLQASALLCLGTAQAQAMPAQVVLQLQRIVVDMERAIRRLLVDGVGVALMERNVRAFDEKYARLKPERSQVPVGWTEKIRSQDRIRSPVGMGAKRT